MRGGACGCACGGDGRGWRRLRQPVRPRWHRGGAQAGLWGRVAGIRVWRVGEPWRRRRRWRR
eukprot:7345811-Prymnesium_polylepis.1